MVSISTRRGGGGSSSPRYRLRRVLLVAVAVGASLYGLSLRLLLRPPPSLLPATHSVGGPPPRASSSSSSSRRSGSGGEEPAAVIAHAVSLIKCSRGPSVAGFLDAAAVLRHSIHKNSIHYRPPNPNGNSTSAAEDAFAPPSRYSYQMYAIVHPSCAQHARVLGRLGYEIMVRDHPVKKEDIRGEWLRNHIEAENCCGSAEFIKLYAYHLTDHPVAVHWDMDVAILRPLDDLYDVMLLPADDPRSVAARGRIERQHPDERWPERVDAFLTRDLTSAMPWEKRTAVQGGFLVARPDVAVFDAYIDFIKEGNYVGGRGDGTGWAGLGYGGFQGAMAYQGVVAYYYDQLRPNTAVELNVCRWNQVAADVLWRGPQRKDQHHLQCREHPRTSLPNGEPDYASNTKCEDCRGTPVSAVRSAHYTACKKPWECKVAHPRNPRDKRQVYRLQNLVNVTYCMELVREWFVLRREFEEALESASEGRVRKAKSTGGYEEGYFLGYCHREGGYVAMEPPPEDFDVKRIYGM